MGFSGEHSAENILLGFEKEDSGSDNNDAFPRELHPHGYTPSIGSSSKGKRPIKRFHRHTPRQIEELESFFSHCAHPDEKQRLALGRRLGLETRQVKFWFQNRRTQMKSQIERHENVSLKKDYDKLRLENIAMKDKIRNPICDNCGGPAILGEVPVDQQNLRIENARLKEELIRVNAIAEKLIGRRVSDYASQITATTVPMGINGANGLMGSPNQLISTGHNLESGASNSSPMNGVILTSEYEKTVFKQAGIAAMDELLALAQADSPFWFEDFVDGRQILNYEEYSSKYSPLVDMRSSSLIIDATKETSSVFVTSFDLVETMMTPWRWKNMFPCLVGNASTIEVLFTGENGTRDGELQLMNADIVFPSPFVPLRQDKFLRYAKQHSETTWAVVDVSLDTIREASFSNPSVKWRRFPSGFIIQDLSHGFSLVTWIEHGEYDEHFIHHLYRPLLRSGFAFGAQRWMATLLRERECVAALMSTGIVPEVNEGDVIPEGKRSIIKLMKRISNNLCAALYASSSRHWQKIQIGVLTADVSIMSRVSIGDLGEPSGVVLSASTSVWIPVARHHLFNFLRDEHQRGNWDVLANGGPMEVIAGFPKSRDGTNIVSLLCPPAAPPRESNMLILQESWSDQTSSFIVYAPVDSASMESVLRGADSDYLALLPSGFAIADGIILTSDGDPNPGGASVLTMGFQILVNSLPTATINVESADTVNNLVSTTIQKIRAFFGVN